MIIVWTQTFELYLSAKSVVDIKSDSFEYIIFHNQMQQYKNVICNGNKNKEEFYSPSCFLVIVIPGYFSLCPLILSLENIPCHIA